MRLILSMPLLIRLLLQHGFHPRDVSLGLLEQMALTQLTRRLGHSQLELLLAKRQQLLSLREEQFKLRMAKATGQLGQSHLLKQTKRDIARVKTVLQQKAEQ